VQQDENSVEGAKEGGQRGRCGRPVIRVKIQANTSYKICPSDPQDDREDIWRYGPRLEGREMLDAWNGVGFAF
jgi:hypothetical protein